MSWNPTKTLAGALVAGSLALGGVAYAEGQKKSPTKESEEQAQKRIQRKRQVSGTVINMKTVEIRGTKAKNTIALLQTQKKNRRLVVDLGPQEQAKSVKKGQKIAAEGVVVTMRGEPVLVANRFKEGGKITDVQRMMQAKQHKQKQQKQQKQQK